MATSTTTEIPDVLAEDIDLTFVPRPVASVASRDIDGELVLLDAERGSIHRLDPIGSVVWSCFDGDVALGELVTDLAEAYNAPAEVVGDDVITLTKTLAQRGLLDGIAAPQVPGRVEPVSLPAGEAPVDFTLPDLDGNQVSLSDFRGQSLLLINWSPNCGYCIKIAAELGSLKDELEANGTKILLLTTGDAETNSKLLAEHSAQLQTVTKHEAGDEFTDPFPGMGTPAAYLLDAEGRVTGPWSRGADEVPKLARRTAGRTEAVVAQSDVNYLPGASSGMCGSGGSATKKPRVWTDNVAYTVGEYHVGIRTDSKDSDAVIARALGDRLVADDPNAPANYSVVLGAAAGPKRELKLLLSGNTTVCRSRSTTRVLRALGTYLSHIVDNQDELYRTNNMAVLHGTDAWLLPPSLVGQLETLQPKLAKLGMRIVDQPFAMIDAETRELVVAEGSVQLDLSEYDGVEEPLGRSELPAVEPGRYRISTWVMLRDAETHEEVSRAFCVSQALNTVLTDAADLPDVADKLEKLLTDVSIVTVHGGHLDHFTDDLKPHVPAKT